MNLYENEKLLRVNDNLALIQKSDGLTFGTDALLLAGYISGTHRSALELGGGTGIISMLLATRGKADKIDCVEIQEEYADLIGRNIALNGLEGKITPLLCDARDFKPSEEYSLCFTNPPYMRSDSGRRNVADKKNIARHEVHGTIRDFLLAAARALKYGGSFACVYRADRLSDLFAAMREAGIEPKRLTMVHGDLSSPPSMLLLEGKRGGRSGLRVTPPLVIYREGERRYTDDMDYIMENGTFPDKFRV